jgi:transglutaminase/protease-like cytokinesis protein 3
MRFISIGFFTLICAQIYAQSNPDLDRVDRFVSGIKPAPPAQLARGLTEPFTTEIEKVRAIFRWITLNITYGSGQAMNKRDKINLPAEDTSPVYKPLNERIAEAVIARRWAVCDGYARLFKTLCDYAGIKAEVISGYVRAEPDRIGYKFNTNHTWNAVFIDSTWKLLDVTWASGYCIYGGSDYLQHYNDIYFLTPPEEFVRDHYPENPQWTLLPKAPLLQEYYSSPFKPSGFIRSRIKSFYPLKGIINASAGDTVSIVLETEDKEKELLVVDTFYDEEHAYDSVKAVKPKYSILGKKIRYDYVVQNENAEWLSVVVNDRIVLRYKLNIQKPFGKDISRSQ